MFPWEQLQVDLRCTLYCLQKVVVMAVGRWNSLLNVFSHVEKLFCGLPTPGCSSPLSPTGVVQQAACPCLIGTQEGKRCHVAHGTMAGLQIQYSSNTRMNTYSSYM